MSEPISIRELRDRNSHVLAIKPHNFAARITPAQVLALLDLAEAAHVALQDDPADYRHFTPLGDALARFDFADREEP